MAHCLLRRAALTAASIAALAAAASAQAQTRQSRDCRYEPHHPLAAPYWVDNNGCLRMRTGGRDVFVTGAVAPRAGVAGPAAAPRVVSQAEVPRLPDCRYEPNFSVAAPYWVDHNGCLRMRQNGQDVFVTGSIAPPTGRIGTGVGTTPGVGLPPAGGVSPVVDGPRGPVGGNRPNADNPPGRGPGVDHGRAGGNRPGNDRGPDGRNNNGLGNGYDPGDPGFNSETDVARGSDPSNPAHGNGAAGPGNSGDRGGGGNKGGNGKK